MGIVRVAEGVPVELTASPYESEARLEAIVASYPALLVLPDEPQIALVKQQVTLPRAGLLDILMVNEDGLPIAVEVKLARNGQSRREVVGQLVDYVSALTSLTVDELDQSVGGLLDKALHSFSSGEEDEESFEKKWQAVGTNLRAGLARCIIVVDEVPADLERIIRFLVERSNLDIRLVQIQKYPDRAGQEIYVPINIVDVAQSERPQMGGAQAEIPSDFQAVLDSYSTKGDRSFPLIGQGRTYRIVRPTTWAPSLALHYEFVNKKKGVSAEIHLESEKVRFLDTMLKQFAEQQNASFPYLLRWDPNWSSGKGRLILDPPDGSTSDSIAEAMCALSKLTYEKITVELRKKGLVS